MEPADDCQRRHLRALVDPVATHLRELYEQGAYDAMFRPPHGPLTA